LVQPFFTSGTALEPPRQDFAGFGRLAPVYRHGVAVYAFRQEWGMKATCVLVGFIFFVGCDGDAGHKRDAAAPDSFVDNCTESILCKKRGWCTWFKDAGCMAGSNADCKKSELCHTKDYCTWMPTYKIGTIPPCPPAPGRCYGSAIPRPDAAPSCDPDNGIGVRLDQG